MTKLLNFAKFMQARRTLFCYSGPLSEDLLTQISNPVRQQLSESDSDEGVAKRVFGVFVEQAQNIIRYATARRHGRRCWHYCDQCYRNDAFLIEAVNAIDSETYGPFESTLLELSMKDAKELEKNVQGTATQRPAGRLKGCGIRLYRNGAQGSALRV